MADKAIRFKTFPFYKKNRPDRSCWWTVVVHVDRKALLKATFGVKCAMGDACPNEYSEDGERYEGICHMHRYREALNEYGVKRQRQPKGELGEIHLHRKALGGEIVSHETCHAMTRTLVRFTDVVNFSSPAWIHLDEAMAYMLGRMVKETYRQLYRRKIIE